MSNRYHYDSDGNYRGKTTNDPPLSGLFALFFLGGVVFGVAWVWDKISNYSLLDAPYSYVAAFYFFSINCPLILIAKIYSVFTFPGFTPWPNINLIFAISAVCIFVLAVLYGFVVISRFLNKSIVMPAIFIAPATFALLWFIGGSLIGWLFLPAQPT